MKKFSKVLSFVFTLCLCAALLPAFVFAENRTYEQTEPGEMHGKTVIVYTSNMRGNIDLLPQIVALRNLYGAKGAEVILVDTGNFLQGTIYSAYDSGRTVIELMDKAGYDVVAIGPREFHFGTGIVGVETHGIIFEHYGLGQLLDEASFYAVAANIVAGDDALYAFGANAVITTASDREIAFFGLTSPSTTNRVIESNLYGLTFTNPVGAAAEQIKALENSDLIIGLSNVGVPMLVSSAVIIDVYYGAGPTVGVVIINNETNKIVSHSLIGLSGVEGNEEIREAVNAAHESIRKEFPINAVSKVTLEGSANLSRSQETNTGNLWTNALRWFALEGGIVNFFDEDDIENGNDRIMVDPENIVAIWNGGNLRDFINIGSVTMNDLQRVLPFPNRVAVMYLTGSQLLEMLEAATQGLPLTNETFAASAAFPHVAGIEFTVNAAIPFDAGEAYGSHWFRANSIGRVSIENINGNPFEPDTTYAIITSNAIFNGMDSNYISLERCEEFSTITSAFVVDVVWMYIMEELNGVIDTRYTAAQGRITVYYDSEN